MNTKEANANTTENALVTLLQSNTKDVMMGIAEKQNVKVYKSHTKQKMADSMKEPLLENIPYLFSFMDENSQATLEKVLYFKKGETNFGPLDAKTLTALAEYGYLYVYEEDDTFEPYLANEVKEAVQTLSENETYKEFAEKHQEFASYVSALLHLYGLYTTERFVKVWNSHHSEELTEEEAADIITRLNEWNFQYTFKNDLVESILFDVEAIDREGLKRNLNVAYYEPTKEDIRYYDNHWLDADSLQYLNMKNYVAGKDLDEFRKNSVLYSIVEAAVIGKTGEKLYQDMTKNGFSFADKPDVDTFISLFNELRKNSRTWHSHGFTVPELNASNVVRPTNSTARKQQPITVHKVGRNDPCPCGSGKKFKKCHGK